MKLIDVLDFIKSADVSDLGVIESFVRDATKAHKQDAFADIGIGDIVHLSNNIRPKMLQGQAAEVVSKSTFEAKVKLLSPPNYKWSGNIGVKPEHLVTKGK